MEDWEDEDLWDISLNLLKVNNSSKKEYEEEEEEIINSPKKITPKKINKKEFEYDVNKDPSYLTLYYTILKPPGKRYFFGSILYDHNLNEINRNYGYIGDNLDYKEAIIKGFCMVAKDIKTKNLRLVSDIILPNIDNYDYSSPFYCWEACRIKRKLENLEIINISKKDNILPLELANKAYESEKKLSTNNFKKIKQQNKNDLNFYKYKHVK